MVVTGELPEEPGEVVDGAVVVVTLGGAGVDSAVFGGGVVGALSWLPNIDTSSSCAAG